MAEANVQQEVPDGENDEAAGGEHVDAEDGHEELCLRGQMRVADAGHELVDHDGHEQHRVEERRADAQQHTEHQRGGRVARAHWTREQEERDHELHAPARRHQSALSRAPARRRHQHEARAQQHERADQLDARHRQEPTALVRRRL